MRGARFQGFRGLGIRASGFRSSSLKGLSWAFSLCVFEGVARACGLRRAFSQYRAGPSCPQTEILLVPSLKEKS